MKFRDAVQIVLLLTLSVSLFARSWFLDGNRRYCGRVAYKYLNRIAASACSIEHNADNQTISYPSAQCHDQRDTT